MSVVNKKAIGKALVHLLAVLIILAPMFAVSPVEAAEETELVARLTGAAEVPGPGDPDGRGVARVVLFGNNRLCYRIRVENIEPATAAHIHVGPRGVAGPIVVPLNTPDGHGLSRGCATIEVQLWNAIRNHPDLYYVNVHNARYPAGAVRGQLQFARD